MTGFGMWPDGIAPCKTFAGTALGTPWMGTTEDPWTWTGAGAGAGAATCCDKCPKVVFETRFGKPVSPSKCVNTGLIWQCRNIRDTGHLLMDEQLASQWTTSVEGKTQSKTWIINYLIKNDLCAIKMSLGWLKLKTSFTKWPSRWQLCNTVNPPINP